MLYTKIVKFVFTLAATFISVFIENYANVWFKSNAIGISIMHSYMRQWRIQSTIIVSASSQCQGERCILLSAGVR